MTKYDLKLVSSQAILKYGIRMAFTQETNPKMKNSKPIMMMETTESRLVREPTSTVVMSLFISTC